MTQHPEVDREIDLAVSRVMAELSALIEVIEGEHAPSARAVAAVERAGRVMDAARVLVAAPFVTDPSAAERLGYASAALAIASLAQVSQQTARARLAVARAVTADVSIVGASLPPAYPQLASAVAAGKVGLDAAALVTRQLDAVAPRVDPEARALAEQVMVNLATGHDPARERALPPVSVDYLAIEIKQLAAAIDPDGARPREERANQRRQLRIGKQDDDGLMPITGRLKPEIGLLLLAAFEAARRSPRFVDLAVVDPALVDDDAAWTASDTRTPDQRRHDVLAELIIAAASQSGSPRLDGAPVTVIVTVEESDLSNPDGLDGDPIGTMAGSTVPVSRAQVERFIDAGGFRRVIKNSHGAVTGIGLPERCFINPQRNAIGARDGYRCSTPGCTSPHYALQVHHVIPYRDGGPTAVDNGILLCYWCHSRVDTGPWRWRMVDGLPEVRGPGYSEWTRLRPPVARAA